MAAYHRSEDDLVIRPETIFLGRLARSTHDEVVQVQSNVSLVTVFNLMLNLDSVALVPPRGCTNVLSDLPRRSSRMNETGPALCRGS